MGDAQDQPTAPAEQLARRNRQLEAIHRITAALGSVTEVKAVVEEALRVSLACVGARDGAVALHDPDRDKLVYTYVIGEKAQEVIGFELGPTEGLAGAVFSSGQLRISQDFSQEADRSRYVEEQLNYRVRNQVTVPLKNARGQTLGVMQVLNRDAGDFDAADAEVLDILGAQIAIAIESARLYEAARLADIVRFIGNLSHDVKNMITPSQTGAETLRLIADDAFARLEELVAAEQPAAGAAHQAWEALSDLRALYPEMLDMVLEGSEAVQQRMVEVSAAVKGIVSEPSFERQPLQPIIERVVKPLRVVAEKAGVTVTCGAASETPDLDLDDRQMYNALYNLVNNAIQATPAGGSVTVRTRMATGAECPAGACVVVEIADTGEGMPPEIRAKAFTDDAVTTKPMGTGLGTKIVKNVMDVHRARIEVDSEVGQGTTIRCLIPVRHPREEG